MREQKEDKRVNFLTWVVCNKAEYGVAVLRHSEGVPPREHRGGGIRRLLFHRGVAKILRRKGLAATAYEAHVHEVNGVPVKMPRVLLRVQVDQHHLVNGAQLQRLHNGTEGARLVPIAGHVDSTRAQPLLQQRLRGTLPRSVVDEPVLERAAKLPVPRNRAEERDALLLSVG